MENALALETQNNCLKSYVEVERYLTGILLKLGVSCKNMGFFFTKEAVKIAYFKPASRFNMNKYIFNALSTHFGLSVSKIERSIRHVLSFVIAQNKIFQLEELFEIGKNYSTIKPSVCEFITLLCESIQFSK